MELHRIQFAVGYLREEIRHAQPAGFSSEDNFQLTKIARWFLSQMKPLPFLAILLARPSACLASRLPETWLLTKPGWDFAYQAQERSRPFQR